jgi:hypothetical protein
MPELHVVEPAEAAAARSVADRLKFRARTPMTSPVGLTGSWPGTKTNVIKEMNACPLQ